VRSIRSALAGLVAVGLALAGCTAGPKPAPSRSAVAASPSPAASPSASSSASPPARTAGVPRFDHVVVAVFENHGYGQVIGAGGTPYLNELASRVRY